MVFVKLIVADLPAMTAFYDRAFGLTCVRTIQMEGLEEAVLQRPGDERGPSLILYHHTDKRPLSLGTAHGPIGLAVPDVDAAFAQAVSVGGRPHRQPFDVPGMRIAFVLDPEGHEIELVRFG
jgi:predicted enzyme related to lactoylglutathione lyase